MAPLTIGEAARHAGVAVDTVRFYERRGLLPEPPRRPSGYRQYSPESVARLRFIRRAKTLGFSLVEIHDLLSLQTDSPAACRQARDQAQRKLGEVEARLRDLEAIRRSLRRLIDRCEAQSFEPGCPLIAALAEENP